ncbi:MAG TPA: hypothetical protein VML55_04960, partial [Planctomycetaceae bacterium]|nr:hypothetical protein [Planctomycetaceae bacterium]
AIRGLEQNGANVEVLLAPDTKDVAVNLGQNANAAGGFALDDAELNRIESPVVRIGVGAELVNQNGASLVHDMLDDVARPFASQTSGPIVFTGGFVADADFATQFLALQTTGTVTGVLGPLDLASNDGVLGNGNDNLDRGLAVRAGGPIDFGTQPHNFNAVAASTGPTDSDVTFRDAFDSLTVGTVDELNPLGGTTPLVGITTGNATVLIQTLNAGAGDVTLDSPIWTDPAGGMVHVLSARAIIDGGDPAADAPDIVANAAELVAAAGIAGDDGIDPANAALEVDVARLAATTLAGSIVITDVAGGVTVDTVGATAGLSTGGGPIVLTTLAGGNIHLAALVQSPAGRVDLHAAGAIVDANDPPAPALPANNVLAADLVMTADSGIGSGANALETQVTRLEAAGGTGGVFVFNTGSLTIGGISPLVGVSATGDDIDITAASPLTVNENVVNSGAGGGIRLLSDGAGDLVVNATAMIHAQNGGDVSLDAGSGHLFTHGQVTADNGGNIGFQALSGNVSVTAPVTANAGGDIMMLAGNPLLPGFGNLDLGASVQALGGGSMYLQASALLNPLTTGRIDIRNAGTELQVTDEGTITGVATGVVGFHDEARAVSETGVVKQVSPSVPLDQIFTPQITATGQAMLTMRIGVNGEENFTVRVDWGDGTVEEFFPPSSPDPQTAGVYTFLHTYSATFNPDPALGIPFQVEVRNDPLINFFGDNNFSGGGDAFRFFAPNFIDGVDARHPFNLMDPLDQALFNRTLSITTRDLNFPIPGEGIGAVFFVFDTGGTTAFVRQPEAMAFFETTPFTTFTQSLDFSVGTVEQNVADEREVVVEILQADGTVLTTVTFRGPEADEFLNNLPAYLKRLPDGRYRILLKEPGEERLRLIRDLLLRDGVPADVKIMLEPSSQEQTQQAPAPSGAGRVAAGAAWDEAWENWAGPRRRIVIEIGSGDGEPPDESAPARAELSIPVLAGAALAGTGLVPRLLRPANPDRVDRTMSQLGRRALRSLGRLRQRVVN